VITGPDIVQDTRSDTGPESAQDTGPESAQDSRSDAGPDTGTEPDVAFLTNRTAVLDESWPARLKVYDARHLSLEEVEARLGVDQAPRTVIDESLNRYGYETPDATVEIAFDDGLSEPCHYVSYATKSVKMDGGVSPPTDLATTWQQAAGFAAGYLRRLTTLTPFVYAGTTDEDLQSALLDSFWMALLIEGRGVLIDDLGAQASTDGLHSFHTDRLPFEVVGSHEVDVWSRAEVEQGIPADKILNLIGLGTNIYLYVHEEHVLTPFVLYDRGEGIPTPIPLDRSRSMQ
jgi:hypothetical protein